MKKYFFLFILFLILGLQIFAQEPVKETKQTTESKELNDSESDRKRILEIEEH